MAEQHSPVVSVIVVSYKTRDLTFECLRALHEDLAGIDAEVWVVDNASDDGSADAIVKGFPTVKLIANSRNAGFGAANNQAMRLARGDYLLLLNSDAFVQPGAVGALVEYLGRNPGVAVVGPRLLNADGSLQISCFPFPSPMRTWLENLWISKLVPINAQWGDYYSWPHDRERLVPWLMGACLLVRRGVFEQIGGFDEKIFMYGEETDWQQRMRGAGWEVGFTPSAQVRHLGGASAAIEPTGREHFLFQSIDYYEQKHYGSGGWVAARLARIAGVLLRLPLWVGMLVFAPKRRQEASMRLRFLIWLLVRQTTNWRSLGRKVTA